MIDQSIISNNTTIVVNISTTNYIEDADQINETPDNTTCYDDEEDNNEIMTLL